MSTETFCTQTPSGVLVQGEARGHKNVELHVMGDVTVTVDKMFGPLIFMPLRVTASTSTCEWIVERQGGPDDEWTEVARVPGQLDSDFPDDPPSPTEVTP